MKKTKQFFGINKFWLETGINQVKNGTGHNEIALEKKEQIAKRKQTGALVGNPKKKNTKIQFRS